MISVENVNDMNKTFKERGIYGFPIPKYEGGKITTLRLEITLINDDQVRRMISLLENLKL